MIRDEFRNRQSEHHVSVHGITDRRRFSRFLDSIIRRVTFDPLSTDQSCYTCIGSRVDLEHHSSDRCRHARRSSCPYDRSNHGVQRSGIDTDPVGITESARPFHDTRKQYEYHCISRSGRSEYRKQRELMIKRRKFERYGTMRTKYRCRKTNKRRRKPNHTGQTRRQTSRDFYARSHSPICTVRRDRFRNRKICRRHQGTPHNRASSHEQNPDRMDEKNSVKRHQSHGHLGRIRIFHSEPHLLRYRGQCRSLPRRKQHHSPRVYQDDRNSTSSSARNGYR